MFKDVRSLKAFITYCKKENIIEIKVGEVALKFAPQTTEQPILSGSDLTELTPDELKKQENEDLYYSSGHGIS